MRTHAALVTTTPTQATTPSTRPTRASRSRQQLSGWLTVRGTTRAVTLTVTGCEASHRSFTARATARIDRTEFGITAARGLAARCLDLTVEVRCTRN